MARIDSSNEDIDYTKSQEGSQSDYTNNDDNSKILSDTRQKRKVEGDQVLVEDPESQEDAFYWNEVSGEMRWDPP